MYFLFQVGLYSDPPKPSTAILSGVIQEGSKVMTLSFPQAQRAEFDAGSANLTGPRDNPGRFWKSTLEIHLEVELDL